MKRMISIFLVLVLMMSLNVLTSMPIAKAESATAFTSWTENLNPIYHLGLSTATSSDSYWGEYRYIAQIGLGFCVGAGVLFALLLFGSYLLSVKYYEKREN